MDEEVKDLLRNVLTKMGSLAEKVEEQGKKIDEKMVEQGKKMDVLGEKVQDIEKARKEDRDLIAELQGKLNSILPTSPRAHAAAPSSSSPNSPPLSSSHAPATSSSPSSRPSSSSVPPLSSSIPPLSSVPPLSSSFSRPSPTPSRSPPITSTSITQMAQSSGSERTSESVSGEEAYERRKNLARSSTLSPPEPTDLRSTYGKGSEIIAKMGWKEGAGLGRHEQGGKEIAYVEKGKQRRRVGLGEEEREEWEEIPRRYDPSTTTTTTTTSTLPSLFETRQKDEGRKRHRDEGTSEKQKKLREDEQGKVKVKEERRKADKEKEEAKGMAEISLLTPLYELQYAPQNIFIHEIDFKPIGEKGGFPGRDLKRQLLYKGLEKDPNDPDVVFDGGRQLFLHEEMNKESVSVLVEATSESYAFSVKCAGPLDKTKVEQVEQFLSIKFKQLVHSMGYPINIGGFQFSPDQVESVKAADLWRGYHANVVLRQAGMFLKITAKNRIIWKGTALDYLRMKAGRDPLYEKGSTRKEIRAAFKDKLMLTTHANNIYSFKDVDFNLNPRCTFAYGRNQDLITYLDYYKLRYNVDIKEMKQPMFKLVDKSGREAVIPGELCRITGLPDGMTLDDVRKHLTKPPAELYKEFTKFSKKIISLIKDQKIEGLVINNNMYRFKAHILPASDVLFTPKHVDKRETEAIPTVKMVPEYETGAWETYYKNCQFYETIQLTDWVVFSCLDDKPTQSLVNNFTRVCTMNGVRCNRPAIQRFRESNFTQDIETAVRGMGQCKPQLVFVTLPFNDKAKNKPQYEFTKIYEIKKVKKKKKRNKNK